MIKEETKTLYIYDANIKYSKKLFTLEGSLKAYKSLINCSDLLGCVFCSSTAFSSLCIYCKHCKFCYHCDTCKNCKHCKFCEHCYHCDRCDICYYCYHCDTCKYCYNCKNSKYLYRCNGLDGKEYYIDNKPMTQEQIDYINQYGWHAFVYYIKQKELKNG